MKTLITILLSILFTHAAQSKDSVLTVTGVGDIMLGSNYPSSAYLPPNDGAYVLSKVSDHLRSSDVTIGNLEGCFHTGPASTSKTKYAFKMPDHYTKYLKDAGFDAMSIANNHIRDFGTAGTTRTKEVLKYNGIAYAGLEECPYTVFEKDGVKYGLIAFAPNMGTVSINNIPKAKRLVAQLDSISDIVIVFFHGGAEGSKYTHITRAPEKYLGENRGDPYHFSRAVIDAGADIVFGSGPHVTRAVDLYKDRFIAYSLGNFATSGTFNINGTGGHAPIITVSVDRSGKFSSAKVVSTHQVDKTGPRVDPNNSALKEIITLTRSDIPESNLRISPDGLINKK